MSTRIFFHLALLPFVIIMGLCSCSNDNNTVAYRVLHDNSSTSIEQYPKGFKPGDIVSSWFSHSVIVSRLDEESSKPDGLDTLHTLTTSYHTDNDNPHMEMSNPITWEFDDCFITYIDETGHQTVIQGRWQGYEFIMLNDTLQVVGRNIVWIRPSAIGGTEQTVFK